MLRLYVFASISVCTSCSRTWTDFHPYSATAVQQAITDQAVFAYPGDVGRLREVGGELVGMITVDGNGFATRDDVRIRSLDEAASLGGTHVFIAGEEANTNWASVSPDRAVTTVNGNAATTTFQAGRVVPITTQHGSYVVVRVPPERWARLPTQLRPLPNLYAKHEIDQATDDDDDVDAKTPPAAHDVHWYCRSEADDRCFRAKADCLGDNDDDCDDETTAFCFAAARSTGDETATSELDCSATMLGCRKIRDAAFGSGAKIVNECTASE